jgi:uncharacterized protein YdhG (YjbR/CyaY superfamily)
MNTNQPTSKTIDEYIATFPQDIQEKLEQIRATIRAAAPDAEETISYKMPSFALRGSLVHFAAWKKHIGFYGDFGAMQALKDEISVYANEKGILKFPIDKPLPLKLIGEIVRLKVAENLRNAKEM